MAARAGAAPLAESQATLQAAARRCGLAVDPLMEQSSHRAGAIERFRETYAHYCWEVASLADLRLAPFHVLASEGEVHVERITPGTLRSVRLWYRWTSA